MRVRSLRDEGGFALLVLFGIMAASGVGLVVAIQVFAPPLADATRVAEENLAVAEIAARDAFRKEASFGASLAELVDDAPGLRAGPWTTDPWGNGSDLVFESFGASVRIRSRGGDGLLGTADDLVAVVPSEPMMRVRQRNRLRLIRALLYRSPYRFPTESGGGDEKEDEDEKSGSKEKKAKSEKKSGSKEKKAKSEKKSGSKKKAKSEEDDFVVSGVLLGNEALARDASLELPSEALVDAQEEMRVAMRDYAIARRLYLTSDAAVRAALQQAMDDAAATVSSICTLHGCPELPPAVTGAGGLMNYLGLPDTKAVDGVGDPLIPDPIVGVVARGSDGTGGTADDM